MADKNGKPICNLLFMTLKSTDWVTEKPTNVTYLLCQGWFDILIHGVFQDLPLAKSIYQEGAQSSLQSIVCKLDADDTAELLVQAAQFLSTSLNMGNFEGVSGAKQHIVLKLQMGYALVFILNYAQDSQGN